jgi:hypothetical protein
MDKTFQFQSLPTLEELASAIGDLPPPYSVEIQQGMKGSYAFPYPYHEFIDCDNAEELHDFLCDDEHGIAPGRPFTVIVESIGVDESDDNDHPSLTASERNPSLR